jgi:hypothetical protein
MPTYLQKPKKKKNAPEGEDDFVVRWQNPALQADLVAEKLRTLNPKMSSIELGELAIPGRFTSFLSNMQRKHSSTLLPGKSPNETRRISPSFYNKVHLPVPVADCSYTRF